MVLGKLRIILQFERDNVEQGIRDLQQIADNFEDVVSRFAAISVQS